jgi:Uncharacterized protein conserved in archaea
MPEKYVTLAEVKEILEAESAKREVSTQQRAALEHAQAVVKLSLEDTQKLIDEVNALEFTTDYISHKVADILPKYPEDIRAVFAKERITLSAEDIQQIIDIVVKYL